MLIKALPGTIIRKLQEDEQFSPFLQPRFISYKGLSPFHYEDILIALETIKKLGDRVGIVSTDDKNFFLIRSPEGIRIVNTESKDDGQLVHDLAFLYPEKDVRLEAFNNVIKHCPTLLPSASYWQKVLADRPLSETEFFRLISNISETPEFFKSTLKNHWCSGCEINITELFPPSLSYYVALVGSPDEGMSADAWIDSILLPNLSRHIDQSLLDGLKCALALNIDSKLSPVKLVNNIPASELVAALSVLMETRSPLVLLGITEIALFHHDSDAKLLELASTALERLLGNNPEESGIMYEWVIMPSLIKAGLRRMSVDEKLWHYPPYWRRLAAFAHANVLIETLEMDSRQAVDDFTGWLDDLITPKEISAAFLDMREESMWKGWDMTPFNFKAIVVGRLMLTKNALEESGLVFPNSHLVDSAIEDLGGKERLLLSSRSSPLQDRRSIESMQNDENIDSDSVIELFSDIIDELDREPTGIAWQKIVVVCRLQYFDNNLFDNLIRSVGNLIFGNDEEEKEKFFNTLESAAEIATVQRCKALADAVTHALVKAAGKFSTALEAKIGYYIILMSSGAIADDSDWTEWIGKKMSEYAFSLPKGEACQQLLTNLDDLSTLIPLQKRCLGRARKFASSAIY